MINYIYNIINFFIYLAGKEFTHKCLIIFIFSVIFMSYFNNDISKYEFCHDQNGNVVSRCNKMTGNVEYFSTYFGRWERK